MKYDAWFCDCGVIQLMDNDNYDWLAEKPETRRVIRVCQHCGRTRIQWLDKHEEGYDVCGADFIDKVIDGSDGFEYRILLNSGIKVPLKCGWYADAYQANRYMNWDYLEHHVHTTYIPDAEKEDPGCCTVDVQRLIREVNDDEKIQSIAGYYSGIDWSGTKYAR